VRFLLAFLQLRELAAVRELALTDELTGAPNRRALYAALDKVFVREEQRGTDAKGFALALIDLDHFKEVNDSFGHAVGDELLQAVVTRFDGALRALQTPHLLARLGGDEFAVVLHEAGSHNAAMACGSALQESLVEPIVLRDVVLHAQASIGVATAPLHATNRGDMLFAADAAMYAAKTSGESVCFHSPAAVGDRRERLFVAEDLYTALERHELTVEYQPILTVDGEIKPVERVRTSGRAFDKMVENLRTMHADGVDGWIVQHIQAPEQAQRMVQRGRELFGTEPLFVSEVGPVIGVYLGPGMIGVAGIPTSALG